MTIMPHSAAMFQAKQAWLALAIFAASGAAAWGEQPIPPEPSGYRTEDYRAPVPATLAGARVVATAEAAALWRDKAAVFVDVMPQAPRPANLPPGTIWRDRPRLTIPGSAWLPDTGYGELAASTEAYLRTALGTLTGGDPAKPILLYCLRDCWMSWNAAKRAVSWGYANVIWFPDGTDGWGEADLPLAEAKPWTQGGP
jgi:PQQ-dependent catabolism-associated CXXCW motif protein